MDLIAWLAERAENCARIGRTKFGADRRGWEDDERYFRQAIAELSSHRRSVRAFMDEAEQWFRDHYPYERTPDLAALLARVDRSATERAAGIADKIAGDPPGTPSGRHDDWQIGHQDGAMECAAAIRAAEPGEK